LPATARGREAARVSSASDVAELSSVRAQLDELTARVVSVCDRYRSGADSAVTNDLDQVERSLLAATRALTKAQSVLAEMG
jgi:hypothetical protein